MLRRPVANESCSRFLLQRFPVRVAAPAERLGPYGYSGCKAPAVAQTMPFALTAAQARAHIFHRVDTTRRLRPFRVR
jgi:hypothetical protein